MEPAGFDVHMPKQHWIRSPSLARQVEGACCLAKYDSLVLLLGNQLKLPKDNRISLIAFAAPEESITY